MGFLAVGSLGSHISMRGTHDRRIESQFFNLSSKQQNTIGFKFSEHIQGRRIFLSRREPIEFDERKSPNEVREEIKRCYELVNRLGRGVVYLGSSRMGPSHSHYLQAQELAKEVANLLGCTTWGGAGPGLMDAVIQGALQAGKPVGGFKIAKEAGEWTASNFHPYLSPETYLTCRFFSARKHGLVDAVVRDDSSVKTAVIALPGGIGTLDEVFEIMALIQLKRVGSELPFPFLLMNYDTFYSKLLDFLNVCEDWGTVSKGEVGSLWRVCNSNAEALAYLAEFYSIPLRDKSEAQTKAQSTHDALS